jgi:hypothetical protein
MKYAWIENERIRDICQGGNPEDCYAADVAVNYNTLVPDEAQNGDGYVNGQWIPAPPPAPTIPPPQTWNDVSVRAGLTLTDKTRWDNNDTQEIVTAKIEFQTPQQKPYTTELLDYLVASNSISQTSRDKVLAETSSESNVLATTQGTVPDVIG